jgi:hypothetical protein
MAKIQMDDLTKRAYRAVLSAGLLHLKWDLACWIGGADTKNTEYQSLNAECASFRAAAFHNLAIYAVSDFVDFSEEYFWDEIARFNEKFPDAVCPYRQIFERALRGEAIHIIAPDGIGAS